MDGLDDIRSAIASVPLRQGRRLIAIAGPPASGKSTFAAALAAGVDGAKVLPMDGFHLDNDTLQARGLLPRKGAPQTFDVDGFYALLTQVRAGGGAVDFPTFDRSRDCVVPAGGQIAAADHTILVEGNYLLLKDGPWRRLHPLWDFTIRLDVPEAELEARLVARWMQYGHDKDMALRRAQANDLPNAQLTQTGSVSADVVLQNV